jgi:hypothetical protein|tara:strand:- start:611 stop:763 length:153 start_codon:yes stop_codon:yes gene_type:complete
MHGDYRMVSRFESGKPEEMFFMAQTQRKEFLAQQNDKNYPPSKYIKPWHK